MRNLKAFVQIKAPVETVLSLTEARNRDQWMARPRSIWVRTVAESWETCEHEGGTLLSLQMQYQYRLPFVDLLAGHDYQQSVAKSLGRLKAIAESLPVLNAALR